MICVIKIVSSLCINKQDEHFCCWHCTTAGKKKVTDRDGQEKVYMGTPIALTDSLLFDPLNIDLLPPALHECSLVIGVSQVVVLHDRNTFLTAFSNAQRLVSGRNLNGFHVKMYSSYIPKAYL